MTIDDLIEYLQYLKKKLNLTGKEKVFTFSHFRYWHNEYQEGPGELHKSNINLRPESYSTEEDEDEDMCLFIS